MGGDGATCSPEHLGMFRDDTGTVCRELQLQHQYLRYMHATMHAVRLDRTVSLPPLLSGRSICLRDRTFVMFFGVFLCSLRIRFLYIQKYRNPKVGELKSDGN